MKTPEPRAPRAPYKAVRLPARCVHELTQELPRLLACRHRKELSDVAAEILSRHILMSNLTFAAIEPARGEAYVLHSREEAGIRIERNIPALFTFQAGNASFQSKLNESLRQLLQTRDWVDDNALRKTAAFQEFLSFSDHERQLVLLESRPDGTRVSFGIQREGSDFTPHERAVFEFLRPYILAAYDRIATTERTTAALGTLTNSLFRSTTGVIELDSKKRIVRINPTAEAWLQQMGGKSGVGECLPPALATGATEARMQSPNQGCSASWKISVNREVLSAELAWNPQTETFLLLLEKIQEKEPARNHGRLNLSPRQLEVLTWIAQGKSNDEIAIILGLSSSTVAKHVEHIFIKLGVETRTAAAAQAWALSLPGLESM